ncbi:MAG: enoyl-CoA hydratase [Burkholderiaceae bacterium]|nr:enoyl-CoA hydratase [Burkholderiaceae bacterium]
MSTAAGTTADAPIRVERNAADGYAVITIDAPATHNALSKQMRADIAKATGSLARDDAIRVLILTAEGPLFTAGLDLDEWTADEVAAGAFELDPVRALRAYPGPVIGAINGPAITGGFEISVACDVLIAAERASFTDTHARVGLLPGWGLSARLPRLIGLQRAKLLAFGAQPIYARTALAWGLVAEVVPNDALMPRARALATQMASADPDTLRAYKRLLDDTSQATLGDALAIERSRAYEHNARVGRDDVLAALQRIRESRRRPS